MNLNDIHRGVTKHKKRKRIGRGPGSGHGKTAGRGHKGQGSRAGKSFPVTFEGGRMPLIRRVPKRGFHNQFAKTIATVNVGDLETLFDNGDEVTPQALQAKKRLKGRYDLVKVLGDGILTKKLKVSGHRFSKAALEKIQHAGGEAVTLPASGS